MLSKAIMWKLAIRFSCTLLILGGLTGNANAIVTSIISTNGADVLMDTQTPWNFSPNSESFEITNNSGATWTTFDIILKEYDEFDSLQSSSLTFFSTYIIPAGSTASITNEVMTLSGLSIVNNGILNFSVSIVPSSMTNIPVVAKLEIYGHSTPSSQSVPEPATLFLLASGIAGIGFARRKKI